MAERPAKIGVDGLLNYWDDTNDGITYFSIWWNSREKATQYNGNDIEEARNKISKWLSVNDVPGDTSLYYLRIQSEPEKAYKWNSPIVESIPFRFNAPQGAQINGTDYGMMQAIAGIREDMAEHRRQIEERFEQAEPETDPQEKMWAKINGILENPNIGPVIGGVISSIIGKFIPSMNTQTQAPRVAINGVNDAAEPPAAAQENNSDNLQIINDALVKLQDHCDLAKDLTLLANMADSNPTQFKWLLSMLRK